MTLFIKRSRLKEYMRLFFSQIKHGKYLSEPGTGGQMEFRFLALLKGAPVDAEAHGLKCMLKSRSKLSSGSLAEALKTAFISDSERMRLLAVDLVFRMPHAHHAGLLEDALNSPHFDVVQKACLSIYKVPKREQQHLYQIANERIAAHFRTD
jgi:hypothetical protein